MPGINADRFGPATGAFAITPSDTTIFEAEDVPKALFIGGTGNVQVLFVDDDTPVTLVNLAAGSIYPFKVRRVYSTNTTATNIVGLL